MPPPLPYKTRARLIAGAAAITALAACTSPAPTPTREPPRPPALQASAPNPAPPRPASSAPSPRVATTAQPKRGPAPAAPVHAAPKPAPEVPALRRNVAWDADPDAGYRARQASAKRRQGDVEALFAARGVAFPPRKLLLRAFKRDRRVEVWAASKAGGPLAHVTSYEVCAASGALGPKRQEGDLQVPEGVYRLKYFNGLSRFHLSMQVSYPNAADRRLGHPRHPGGEIMIHGGCASIGCIAITDARIEELWLMARQAAGPVEVHILPARDMAGLLHEPGHQPHRALWRQLKAVDDRFLATRRVPRVRITKEGRYALAD